MNTSLRFSLWMTVILWGFSSLASAAAPLPPPPVESKAWGVSVGYRVRTDLQKSGEQRDFTHSLMSDFYYDFNSQWSVSTSTALRWTAEGQNIPKEQDNPYWDDLTVSADYNTNLTPEIKWLASVSTDFPTGNDSRNESIKDTATVSTGVTALYFEKTLILTGNLSASKLFQSYDISTVSGESNVDNLSTLSATIAYKLFEQSTTLSLNHAFNSVRQINGELRAKNTSTVSAAYKYKQVKIKLDHILGNYEKSDGYQLLFVDDSKRVFRLGVAIEI